MCLVVMEWLNVEVSGISKLKKFCYIFATFLTCFYEFQSFNAVANTYSVLSTLKPNTQFLGPHSATKSQFIMHVSFLSLKVIELAMVSV